MLELGLGRALKVSIKTLLGLSFSVGLCTVLMLGLG